MPPHPQQSTGKWPMLNLGMENSEELLPLTLPLRTLRALQVAVVVKVWVPQSCLTPCHPMDCQIPLSREPACQCRGHGFDPRVRKMPWMREWQPTPVFLPGESHEQKSLTVLQSIEFQRIRHSWSNLACMHACTRNLKPKLVLTQGCSLNFKTSSWGCSFVFGRQCSPEPEETNTDSFWKNPHLGIS